MSILKGAAAGFAATIPMTLTMQALRRWLPRERARPIPPREIIDRTVEKAGEAHRVGEKDRETLTLIGHFAFGTAAGAVYGAGIGSNRSSFITGMTFGLTVWALAYGVGLPSLGLHPAASDDTKERNEVLIASHAVWGAALGHLARTRG